MPVGRRLLPSRGCGHLEVCARARWRHLEMLQWARANGAPWDESTCSARRVAATCRILQWARANGCPWDGETCSEAAIHGHLELLQWARANGCSVGRVDLLPRSGRRSQLEVLKWARANGCSVGHEDLRRGGVWWATRDAAVGASERRSVGRGDLLQSSGRRRSGGVEVGERERLLRGTRRLAPRRRLVGNSRCCSGRERTALRGTRRLAPKQRKATSWRCCSGRERTDVRGTRVLAPMPRMAATWRCSSGRARTALRGFRGSAKPKGGGTRMWCGG